MNELIGSIIKNVGVNQDQAEGGLGAILTLAKDKLGEDGFSKIAGAVGGTDGLMEKFSSLSGGDSASGGGLGGMLSSATSALGIKTDLGGIASMVGALSSLDLDLGTLKKFAPVVSNFLESKGHGDIASKISSFL